MKKRVISLLDDDLDRKLWLKQAKNQSKKLIVMVMFFIFITNYVLPYQFIQDAIAESKEVGSDLQQNNEKKTNLIVSAANPLFENTFGGPMVVEVIIREPKLTDLDESKGEPDVTINGNDLRMAQAIDGHWYAYFADKTMATRADEINLKDPDKFEDTAGANLDFGGFCGPDTTDTDIVGSSGGFPQTEGFAIARSLVGDGKTKDEVLVEVVPTQGTTTFVSCVFIGPSDDPDISSQYRTGPDNHVVREAKQLNTNPNAAAIGQIGLVEETWPIIQLFDFEPTQDVVIFYNRGGDPQTVTLRFEDLDDFTHVKFDRDFHPQNSELHITLIDGQLNIDPTDEDSWTFDTETSSLATIYQMYDESGNDDSQGNGDTEVDISGNLRNLGYGDNGLLEIIRDAQNVGSDMVREDSSSLIVGSPPIVPLQFDVTLVETGPNTGIFVSYDWEDNSNVDIETDAKRGTSAIIKYSDRRYSVVVKNSFGTITMNSSSVGNEWNSGEEIPVTLVDQDLNLNSRADEDLDLNNPDVGLIPSLRIGSPITLASLVNASIGSIDSDTRLEFTIQSFSDRVNLGANSGIVLPATTTLVLNYSTTGSDFDSFISEGTSNAIRSFLNYDLRALETNGTNILAGASIEIKILETGIGADATKFIDASKVSGFDAATAFKGLIDISAGNATDFTDTATIAVNFTFTGFTETTNSLSANTNYTIVVDFFSFGTSGDGVLASDRTNNAIYRMQLEETGDNTATFIGTVEYVMLNQLNINQSSTFDALAPISDEIVIIVHEDLTDEDSPRINYLDLGADGVSTQIADQQEAPSHSGVVSLDSSTYKVADTVVVTLEDQDLNVDSDLIEIYTVVNLAGDPADERVGESGYGTNSLGEPFGTLLFITFDDALWT
ncbi:MAG: hypothetical protein IIA83_06990, partial [Thaumarchaeota archaeon]|nr:hypothetical protein [Nitrososphaerota archaeon]